MSVGSTLVESDWEKRDRLDAEAALEVRLVECASCDGYFDPQCASACEDCATPVRTERAR